MDERNQVNQNEDNPSEEAEEQKRNPTTQKTGSQQINELIEHLCKRFNFSSLAHNVDRLHNGRDKLNHLLQKNALERALGKKSIMRLPRLTSLMTIHYGSDSASGETFSDMEEECEEGEDLYEIETCDPLPNDAWMGFFKGFQTLSEWEELSLSQGKQCIEISDDCELNLDSHLRAGVNCFMIDLFKGTNIDHQKIILKLYENELRVSHEMGFPITSTLFALLSPRLQFTGFLKPKTATAVLNVDDTVILTTNRAYSNCCTAQMIYVNARFLLCDCNEGDFILIGPTIQVTIVLILEKEMHCIVKASGILRSHLPVRFPAKCQRFRMSLEELEDITFSREIGVNMLISYSPGHPEYLEDLNRCLKLLNCETMRLGTRIVLNDTKALNENDLNWIAEKYDAFLLDFTFWQNADCQDSDAQESDPDILQLSPAVTQFVKAIYELKKPIILDPNLFANRSLFVHPENIPDIFYYPDRYVFRCDNLKNSFYFYLLQHAIFSQMPKFELSPLPYCDKSHIGSDSLARSCISACYEDVNVKAIIVCSTIPDMSIKLSHFRPHIPIVCVTSIKSISNYIGMYHHITFLYYSVDDQSPRTHEENVYRSLLFGVIYLRFRSLLKNNQNVMLVYGTEPGTKFPDKYVVYKLQEATLANTLKKILFN